ncbi:hypothetical protein CRG98_039856 [Punica granatum]|uniref:Uncharacterized protein n=1 Tax=Punica granatum TaxID=22663 RepID=A0A2I0I767_PUNGR|nr:hypothetical protein CRG98_039856 [Punica granatum]
MAYVEGDLDWMCETCLDITRELDRSNGDSGNQSALLPTVGVPRTPRLGRLNDPRPTGSKTEDQILPKSKGVKDRGREGYWGDCERRGPRYNQHRKFRWCSSILYLASSWGMVDILPYG